MIQTVICSDQNTKIFSYPTMYDRTHSCRNLPKIPTFILRMCTTFGVSYQNRKPARFLKNPMPMRIGKNIFFIYSNSKTSIIHKLRYGGWGHFEKLRNVGYRRRQTNLDMDTK